VKTTVDGSIRRKIEDVLNEAVRALGVEGELPDLELGRAKATERGEYASSAGMKLARVLKQAPQQIASRLAETIVVPDGAATVEAVAGYVNFRLTPQWLQRLVAEVTATGPTWVAASGCRSSSQASTQLGPCISATVVEQSWATPSAGFSNSPSMTSSGSIT